MDKFTMENYKKWLASDYIDTKDREELKSIKDDEKEIESRFYTNLSFGTAGMRGVRGVGTNRINKYVIRKVTQGLANYIIEAEGTKGKEMGVAIAYDCRIGSEEYAINSALVLAGNGIKTYLYKSLRATPELSFAVRELKCISGIVITASHNPQEYNGYKVYWNDGCQIIDPQASGIVDKVNGIESFDEIKYMDEKEALSKGLLEYISEDIDTKFIEAVKKQIVYKDIDGKENFKIVYSPLHGTGGRPVKRVFEETGFNSVYVTPEQEQPDGNFPTCSYANPEDPAVFRLSIDLAEKVGAKICMANDPDADRIGVAVKNENNEWTYPSGNQIGLLLMNYLLENKKNIPNNAAIISTIVSTRMLDVIAKEKGVKIFRTLTGFKFIGEKIRQFEEGVYDNTFIMGFEDSYGYLVGTHARDKDAVVSTLLIAEMAAYYDSIGTSIPQELKKMYEKYGYNLDGIVAITKKGKDGLEEINCIMKKLRTTVKDTLLGKKIEIKRDFKEGCDGLPNSDVLQFVLDDGTYITARPSGTEPKIKYYFGINGKTEKEANEKLEKYKKEFADFAG